MKYNMNYLEKTLMELHGMLKTVEASMNKPCSINSTTPVLDIKDGGVKRKKDSQPKGKGMGEFVPSNYNPKRKSNSDIALTSDSSVGIISY